MQIDVWSDIACPWCWVGKKHLAEALESLLEVALADPAPGAGNVGPDFDLQGGHDRERNQLAGIGKLGPPLTGPVDR